MHMRVALLVAGTIAAVIGCNVLYAVLDLPYYYVEGFYDGSLALPAALNPLISELWFGETIALLAFPVILYFFRDWARTSLLPWLFAMIIVGCGMIATIHTDRLRLSLNHKTPTRQQTSWLIHKGAIYYQPASVRKHTNSDIPAYLLAQVPVVVAIAAGYSVQAVLDRPQRRPWPIIHRN